MRCVLLVSLFACRATSEEPDGTPTPTTAVPSVDCSELQSEALPYTEIEGIPSSGDFYFDGHELVSHRPNNPGEDVIFRSAPPPGGPEAWSSVFGNIQAMTRLPNGAVGYLSEFEGWFFFLDRSEDLYVFEQYGFEDGSMVLRDAATLYVVDEQGVHVLDLVGGLRSLAVESPPWGTPQAAAVSLDKQQLLVLDGDTIWTVPTDPFGSPLGTVEAWQALPNGLQTFSRGLAMDACGNTFVTAYGDDEARVLRYAAEGGEPTVVFQGGELLRSLAFGSGEGGWEAGTLYASSRERLVAIEVGAPGIVDTFRDPADEPPPDPECPDDSYEGNDTQETATEGFTSGFGLVLLDEDWYQVVVPPGEVFTLTYAIDAPFQDVELISTNGTEDEGPFSSGEFVVASPGESETLRWVRFVPSSDECVHYDFTITSAPLPTEDCLDGIDNDFDGRTDCDDLDCLAVAACAGSCPPEDAFEDNDAFGQATEGVSSAQALMTHEQDADWFEVEVLPGDHLEVVVVSDPVFATAHVDLHNATGLGILTGTDVDGTSSVVRENTGGVPQTFFARVTSQGGACAGYDLEISSGPAL